MRKKSRTVRIWTIPDNPLLTTSNHYTDMISFAYTRKTLDGVNVYANRYSIVFFTLFARTYAGNATPIKTGDWVH